MNELYSVVTIQEAAEMYCYAQNTIRYHMNRGNLEFRKVGGDLRGVYLISLASLIKLWGNPRKFVS